MKDLNNLYENLSKFIGVYCQENDSLVPSYFNVCKLV